MSGSKKFGGALVVGVIAVAAVIAAGVVRYPASIQDQGRAFFLLDIAMLLAYGLAGGLIFWKGRGALGVALDVAWKAGVVAGAVHIGNHLLEFFGGITSRAGQLAQGAGAILLVLAIYAAAGSVARERTGSIWLAMMSGAGCAVLGVAILLSAAISVNLIFVQQVLVHLHEAFLGSGMSDGGAFVVRNALETASEALVRMPVLALVLSLMGAVANAYASRRPFRTLMMLTVATPIVFLVGIALLWYADSLPREARPPYIMPGVLLASVALAFIHPLWSAMRRSRDV